MIYPTLKEIKTSRETIDTFKGYNHNYRIGSGEFYDMKNLCSDHYPVLSPRKQRALYSSYVNASMPTGFTIKGDFLITTEGSNIKVRQLGGTGGTKTIDLGLSEDASMCPKQIVSMGAYIIVFPDKAYVNTNDYSDYGSLEASLTLNVGTQFKFEHCNELGEEIKKSAIEEVKYAIGYKTPDTAENSEILINISDYSVSKAEGSVSAFQYYEASSMWSAIDVYTKITATGIGIPFTKGDYVEISGFKGTTNDYEESIELGSTEVAYLPLLNNSYEICAKDDNYIVVKAIIPYEITVKTLECVIKIARNVPELDFITESNNRLWGCRYGIADNGEFVNEIYASKLGDFKNWNSFQGISTDSYAVSVGTDGAFTGATTHLGYPIFFKENCMHKIYGSYPAQYQVQTTTCRGVEKGSDRSLAIVNEILFYKSPSGICAYDGSLPVEVGYALGDSRYKNAVAGALGNKLYVSMHDEDEVHHMFVYDVGKSMWHKEDNEKVVGFSTHNNVLFYLKDEVGIYCINSNYGSDEVVEWMAETGVIGLNLPDKKYISRLNVRVLVDVGTQVYFYGQYDSAGGWEYLGTVTGSTLKSFLMPIRIKRCDHMRLRIVGKGDAKIYSITKTIENGSDS